MSENKTKNDIKKKRILALIVVMSAILFMAVVTVFVGAPIIRFVKQPDLFREWINGFGFFGEVIFVLLLVFQVVIAIIPGEPFEIFAGYGFGVVNGTVFCLIGALIGTIIIFCAVRKWGVPIFELFFSREKMNNLKFLKNTDKNKVLIFFIFMLPGTPKDLLTFFMGLTDIKLTEWLVISTIARIPSVITSVIGGNTLQDGNYLLSATVFGVTIILSGFGVLIYNLIIKAKNKNASEKEEKINDR